MEQSLFTMGRQFNITPFTEINAKVILLINTKKKKIEDYQKIK